MGIVPSSSSSAGKRRKRKRRRKKRLPGSRRLPRQWHVRKAGFAGCVASRVMLPSVVVRPKMLVIMAGMNQKDRSVARCRAHRRLWQWHEHGWFFLYFSPRDVFSFIVRQARC